MMHRVFTVTLIVVVGIVGRLDGSPQRSAAKGLDEITAGNERFGRGLVTRVHDASPRANVVVSPVSISIVLAALQSAAPGTARDEVRRAFGWPKTFDTGAVNLAARMLLLAFERSQIRPTLGGVQYDVESAWITNRLTYRSVPMRDGEWPIVPHFRSQAEKFFGIEFEATGGSPNRNAPAPKLSEPLDFRINSSAHLLTRWAKNEVAAPVSFHTVDGDVRSVDGYKLDLSDYRYVKTDSFEAGDLPGNRAHMIVVIPANGRSLLDVERSLEEFPDALDQLLERKVGEITMPAFHMAFTWNVAEHLQQMGVKGVFRDLGGIIAIPGSPLREIRQEIDIRVDGSGIRADAGTAFGGIYGGVMGGPVQPFSMVVDRPFLFLIRENYTDALMFAGVVMDPRR